MINNNQELAATQQRIRQLEQLVAQIRHKLSDAFERIRRRRC